MPFLGQDWRSPGEHWVKDKTGNWSKMDYLRRKLLVNLFDDAYSRFFCFYWHFKLIFTF